LRKLSPDHEDETVVDTVASNYVMNSCLAVLVVHLLYSLLDLLKVENPSAK